MRDGTDEIFKSEELDCAERQPGKRIYPDCGRKDPDTAYVWYAKALSAFRKERKRTCAGTNQWDIRINDLSNISQEDKDNINIIIIFIHLNIDKKE